MMATRSTENSPVYTVETPTTFPAVDTSSPQRISYPFTDLRAIRPAGLPPSLEKVLEDERLYQRVLVLRDAAGAPPITKAEFLYQRALKDPSAPTAPPITPLAEERVESPVALPLEDASVESPRAAAPSIVLPPLRTALKSTPLTDAPFTLWTEEVSSDDLKALKNAYKAAILAESQGARPKDESVSDARDRQLAKAHLVHALGTRCLSFGKPIKQAVDEGYRGSINGFMKDLSRQRGVNRPYVVQRANNTNRHAVDLAATVSAARALKGWELNFETEAAALTPLSFGFEHLNSGAHRTKIPDLEVSTKTLTTKLDTLHAEMAEKAQAIENEINTTLTEVIEAITAYLDPASEKASIAYMTNLSALVDHLASEVAYHEIHFPDRADILTKVFNDLGQAKETAIKAFRVALTPQGKS